MNSNLELLIKNMILILALVIFEDLELVFSLNP